MPNKAALKLQSGLVDLLEASPPRLGEAAGSSNVGGNQKAPLKGSVTVLYCRDRVGGTSFLGNSSAFPPLNPRAPAFIPKASPVPAPQDVPSSSADDSGNKLSILLPSATFQEIDEMTEKTKKVAKNKHLCAKMFLKRLPSKLPSTGEASATKVPANKVKKQSIPHRDGRKSPESSSGASSFQLSAPKKNKQKSVLSDNPPPICLPALSTPMPIQRRAGRKATSSIGMCTSRVHSLPSSLTPELVETAIPPPPTPIPVQRRAGRKSASRISMCTSTIPVSLPPSVTFEQVETVNPPPPTPFPVQRRAASKSTSRVSMSTSPHPVHSLPTSVTPELVETVNPPPFTTIPVQRKADRISISSMCTSPLPDHLLPSSLTIPSEVGTSLMPEQDTQPLKQVFPSNTRNWCGLRRQQSYDGCRDQSRYI